MKNKLNLIILCFAFLLFTSPLLSTQNYKVVGYYAGWSMYRSPGFKPKDINPKLLTHINYAFIKVDTKGNLSLIDPWADTDHRTDWNQEKPYWGNFLQLSELKKQNPHLKTLYSIGGWSLSDTFSELAANPAARKNFVSQAIGFCEKYDFDGIDIDWEYPGFAEHSGRPEDKKNFTLLLKELHEAAKTHQPALLVTIAAPAAVWHWQNMELNKIHHYLDWINIMAYDFHGPWGGDADKLTQHHASLYPGNEDNQQLSADNAVKHYVSEGVPNDKIVIGMPLYGRSYRGAQGLFSTYQGPGQGTTVEVGIRFFSDIKNNLLNTYTRYWDEDSQAPYLFNPQNMEYVTYDDEQSLRIKCEYIKNYQLGGAMVWDLGMDNWPTCDAMKTIKNTLSK